MKSQFQLVLRKKDVLEFHLVRISSKFCMYKNLVLEPLSSVKSISIIHVASFIAHTFQFFVDVNCFGEMGFWCDEIYSKKTTKKGSVVELLMTDLTVTWVDAT